MRMACLNPEARGHRGAMFVPFPVARGALGDRAVPFFGRFIARVRD